MAYPTSLKYKNAIRRSGQRKTVIDLYYNRQTTPVMRNLPVISGSISVDGTAATRRSGSATLYAPQLVATATTPVTLDPIGMEVGIRMGLVYADGTEELLPVGKFVITDLTYDDGGNIPTISFQDRSFTISETSPPSGAMDFGGKNTVESILNILNKSAWTNVVFSRREVDDLILNNKTLYIVLSPGYQSIKIPTGNPLTGNYWDNIQGLAAASGAEIYFSVGGGNVIYRPVPVLDSATTDDDANFIVDSGENGILIGAQRGLSRQNSYNAVQATGTLPDNAAENATPPIAFVSDNNPRSRTFYGGAYGKRVLAVQYDNITDVKALSKAANTQLQKVLGLTLSSTVSMVQDPSMEPGDILRVVYWDGTTELHMVQSFSLDLAWNNGMDVTTYNQQVPVI